MNGDRIRCSGWPRVNLNTTTCPVHSMGAVLNPPSSPVSVDSAGVQAFFAPFPDQV